MAKEKEAVSATASRDRAPAAAGAAEPMFSKKGMIIAGAAFGVWTVLLVVLGMIFLGGEPEKKPGEAGEVAPNKGMIVGPIMMLPQLDVGYKTLQPTNPYLSIQVALEFDKSKFVDDPALDAFKKKVDDAMPAVLELIHDAVMVKERQQLMGAENKEALKRDMLQQINRLLSKGDVLDPVVSLHVKRYFFSEGS